MTGYENLTTDEDGYLTGLRFSDSGETAWEDEPVLDETERQLGEYFRGERMRFELPIRLNGTPFQKEVWQTLCGIPYGETVSYGDIAVRIGRPKACRAVGMANHRNPVSIIVPCHRVIGADGRLTGYGGGLSVKEALLMHEQNWKDQHVEV